MAATTPNPTIRKVEFPSKGIRIVGDLYLPTEGTTTDRKKAAIVICHPFGAVKEQSPANHAKVLVAAGFIVLAYDSAYQGESGGEPRGTEDPYQRVEDVKCGVSYLSTLPEVDPERIGALGICAGGGYATFASVTDVRVKALATVSLVHCGRAVQEGILGTPQHITQDIYAGILAQAGADRTEMMRQGFNPTSPPTACLFPKPEEPAADDFHEATEYYLGKRGPHPRATGNFPRFNFELLSTFDPFAMVHLLTPRPVLMIAGTKSQTRIFSEEGIHKAREPKELYLVPGKTHVDLYDQLEGHGEKMVDFFASSLCA